MLQITRNLIIQHFCRKNSVFFRFKASSEIGKKLGKISGLVWVLCGAYNDQYHFYKSDLSCLLFRSC